VAGFPAPRLLVPPERLGRLGLSAEALIDGGALLAAERDSAARFAEALALLVRTAPDPATVSTLAPSPAWVGWDHAAEKLWPAPDDREGDLNGHPGDRWLDEIGTAARRQLLALDRPAVIGHGDWYSQNLLWIDRRQHDVQASVDPAKVLGIPVTVPNDRWSVDRQQLPPCGRADLV
jgi:hypothetical protein